MVAAVVLVFVFIFCTVLLFHLVQQNRYNTATQLESIARSVREPLSSAILKGDIPEAEAILASIKPAGVVSRADVVLPNQFQALRKSFIPERPVPVMVTRLFELPVQISLGVYSLERPANPQPIAYLVLQADSFRMYKFVMSTLSTLVTIYLLLSLILTVAISWCINRLILHPLRNIARELNAIPAKELVGHQLALPRLHHDGLYHHPLYFACNDFVDDQIGRVINALTPEQRENTWVIYTSDHGEMMGAHKLISKGAAMYDDITRIPLIIRSPQGERRQVDTPVSHIDLLPTMMALADIEKPEILPGENILAVKEPRGVMVEFNRYEIEHDSFGGFIPVRCWVTDDFKLVLNLFTSDELYDRRNDPNEMHNLIDDIRFADVRSKMHDALLDYMDKIRDPFRSYQWSLRPWRKDARPRWMGAFRPRPQDGYSPVVRDYDTGLPTQGVKVEEKKQKF